MNTLKTQGGTGLIICPETLAMEEVLKSRLAVASYEFWSQNFSASSHNEGENHWCILLKCIQGH